MDIAELFGGPKESTVPTCGEIWSDREELRRWFSNVFDTILATPPRDFTKIEVKSYQFIHDSRNLYSVSLISILSLRPHNASVSRQDSEYAFCDALLDYFEFRGNEAELFASWISKMVFKVAEEQEKLDYAPADFIRDYLLYKAKRDPLFGRWRMTDRYNYIPLFVSALFAIHIGGLWPQLFDRIDRRSSSQLKLPYKLMEMYLNRFAEKELRFRAVTVDDVKEAMQLLEEYGVVHRDLEPKENDILRALRLSSAHAHRSLSQKAGDVTARFVGSLRHKLPSLDRPATTNKKRAHGVNKLEFDEVA